VAENIFPKYAEAGIKKMAFLVSKEHLVQMSIEQSIEEGHDSPFETKYFNSEQEAFAWFDEA